MPYKIMCVEHLAFLQLERSDQTFNPARPINFSQILHKSAVTIAEIGLCPLAKRLASWKHAGSRHLSILMSCLFSLFIYNNNLFI